MPNDRCWRATKTKIPVSTSYAVVTIYESHHFFTNSKYRKKCMLAYPRARLGYAPKKKDPRLFDILCATRSGPTYPKVPSITLLKEHQLHVFPPIFPLFLSITIVSLKGFFRARYLHCCSSSSFLHALSLVSILNSHKQLALWWGSSQLP